MSWWAAPFVWSYWLVKVGAQPTLWKLWFCRLQLLWWKARLASSSAPLKASTAWLALSSPLNRWSKSTKRTDGSHHRKKTDNLTDSLIHSFLLSYCRPLFSFFHLRQNFFIGVLKRDVLYSVTLWWVDHQIIFFLFSRLCAWLSASVYACVKTPFLPYLA